MAEHVAMALPGGGGGIMQQWEAEASSLPMGEQRHEGKLLLRLWDCCFFFFSWEEEGHFNSSIHTHRSQKKKNQKTSQACMHASKHTHVQPCRHTLSIQWN